MGRDKKEEILSHHTENVTQGSSKEVATMSDDMDEANTFAIDFNLAANALSLCLLTSTISWNQVIPSSAIAFIAQRFPDGASNANWISITPSIMSAVIQAIIGDLSDIFGRRSFLLVACATGVLGTILSGVATSMDMVIAGQIFNGFAMACGFLSSPSLQEMVPKELRPLAIACATLLSSFSFIGGPIIEGLLIQKKVGGEFDGWRVGFYAATGFWALTFVGLFLFYHPMDRPNPENLTILRRLKKIDWFGIFFVASGLTLFLVGIEYGNNPYPWTAATVLGPLLSGAILIVCFVLWEWKGTSTGIIPHVLFKDKNYPVTMIVRVVGGVALLGGQAYLPQIAVNVYGAGGLRTAVWQLPFSVAAIVGSFTAAFLLRIYKEVRWITVGMSVSMVVGAGLLIGLKPSSSFALWFFGVAIIGFASGIEASVLSVVSSLFVPNELIATAVCVCNSATFIGGAIAVTIYTAVFKNKIQIILPAELTRSALEAGLPSSSIEAFLLAFSSGNSTGLLGVPGVTPGVIAAVSEASKKAYADSFRYIWYILTAFAGFCGISALFYTSTKKYMTREVAAPAKTRTKPSKELSDE